MVVCSFAFRQPRSTSVSTGPQTVARSSRIADATSAAWSGDDVLSKKWIHAELSTRILATHPSGVVEADGKSKPPWQLGEVVELSLSQHRLERQDHSFGVRLGSERLLDYFTRRATSSKSLSSTAPST